MKPDDASILRISHSFADDRLTVNPLEDGSGVVLDIDHEQILTLNATGLHIFQSIESGARGHADVVNSLMSHFEVDEERATRDLDVFLERVNNALYSCSA